MSVYGCIGDHYTFTLYFVGRPDIVFFQIMSKVLGKDRSVKRADRLNIQGCCYFEKLLYLRTVFSNDSDIVAACFAVPVLFYIKSSEFTESIC